MPHKIQVHGLRELLPSSRTSWKQVNLISKQILPTGTSQKAWKSEMGICMLLLRLIMYNVSACALKENIYIVFRGSFQFCNAFIPLKITESRSTYSKLPRLTAFQHKLNNKFSSLCSRLFISNINMLMMKYAIPLKKSLTCSKQKDLQSNMYFCNNRLKLL